MASPTTLGGVGMAAIGSYPVGGSADAFKTGTFLWLSGEDLLAAKKIQVKTLEVTEEISGVQNMEFIHQLAAGGDHLSPGQRVVLRHETVNLFLGAIERLDEVKAPGSAALLTRVEAVNLTGVLERRLVTADKAYASQIAGAIVKDLVSTYLDGEALTTNSVQDGATIANFAVKAFTTVAAALRDLGDRTGFIWFVDAIGDLHFEPQTAVQAPFNIGETPSAGVGVPLDGVKVEQSKERYRNRQTVRYGQELTLSVTSSSTGEQDSRKAAEGGSGVYHAVEDASEISSATSSAEATALADALLRRFAVIPTTVEFATRTRGLRAGQTVTVKLPTHNIACADYLIDKVKTQDEGAGILRWDVTALSGEHFADAMDFWRHLAGTKKA